MLIEQLNVDIPQGIVPSIPPELAFVLLCREIESLSCKHVLQNKTIMNLGYGWFLPYESCTCETQQIVFKNIIYQNNYWKCVTVRAIAELFIELPSPLPHRQAVVFCCRSHTFDRNRSKAQLLQPQRNGKIFHYVLWEVVLSPLEIATPAFWSFLCLDKWGPSQRASTVGAPRGLATYLFCYTSNSPSLKYSMKAGWRNYSALFRLL